MRLSTHDSSLQYQNVSIEKATSHALLRNGNRAVFLEPDSQAPVILEPQTYSPIYPATLGTRYRAVTTSGESVTMFGVRPTG